MSIIYNLKQTHLSRYKKLSQTTSCTCTEFSHKSISSTRPVMTMHVVNPEACPVMNNSSNEFKPRSSWLSSQNHRFPKLPLTTFSAHILSWQYYWESLKTTIHNNHTPTDVQGGGGEGIYLPAVNYWYRRYECHKWFEPIKRKLSQSLNIINKLLWEAHKILYAAMKAVFGLSTPSYTLDSLRKSEIYIRWLKSLEQCQDTYVLGNFHFYRKK